VHRRDDSFVMVTEQGEYFQGVTDIKAGVRFIQVDDRCLLGQHPRQHHPALFPSGELVELAFAQVQQVKLLQLLFR